MAHPLFYTPSSPYTTLYGGVWIGLGGNVSGVGRKCREGLEREENGWGRYKKKKAIYRRQPIFLTLNLIP
jgi:hypothetical protein